jgi:hypothetical protein
MGMCSTGRYSVDEEANRERLYRHVRDHPYLYQRDPSTGAWGVNAAGTVMTPVWQRASPFEEYFLNNPDAQLFPAGTHPAVDNEDIADG